MQIKLDENLPNELADELRLLGHDVHTCRDEALSGSADPLVFAQANQEGRLLISFDLDFSDVRRYVPGTHAGIVILRLRSQDIDSIKLAVHRVLNSVPMDDLIGNLVVVDETRIRFRRSETPP